MSGKVGFGRDHGYLAAMRRRCLPIAVLLIVAQLGTLMGWALTPEPAGPARPPRFGIEGAANPAEASQMYNRAVLAVFNGVRRILERFAATSANSTTHEAVLHAAFLDRESRAFYYMTGCLKPASKAGQAIMRRLVGQTVTTNGNMAIDLSFPELIEENGEVKAIRFELDIVCIPARVVENTISAALQAGILGTFVFLAGGLVPFLEHFNADLLARAMSNTVGDVVLCVGMDLSNHGAFAALGGNTDATRRERAGRIQRIFGAGITAMSMVKYLGEVLLSLARYNAGRIVGAAIGAAVGSVLFPASGAIIGGLFSIVAFPIFGSMIITAVSVDIPLWYRMRRLTRLYRKAAGLNPLPEGLGASIRDVEERLLRGVDDGIRKEQYSYFDKLVAKLQKLDASDRPLFVHFIHEIQSKLSFATVADGNWNAARKYYQLLGKLKLDPSNP